jgi:large subunit ribosomal protein L6
MSRIAKKPIKIENDIKVTNIGGKVTVEGSYGKLELNLPVGIEALITEGELLIKSTRMNADNSNIVGLYRSLLSNAIYGVKNQWMRTLELVGVGYRAQTDGKALVLNLGYSHPINVTAPDGISFKVVENKITVTGVDKHMVGETAASIRRLKKPEPYKGKGIRFEGEFIRKKLGKAAKAVGGTGVK